MPASFARSRVTALLGPTNTGKTYLAIERMLGHASGVIGFPLRLLARENYDRIVGIKGAGRVALVTGEEKIIPPHARYYCCTVESMPLEKSFDFLAVDKIQLAADPERGHVFTDRLLHARGLEETMFLGADTIRGLLRVLVPDAEQISRPRFSRLSHDGLRNINRLPPRSAVVAFSAADVYAAAELVRRKRGGTAVVLGALSPRTRNAQVGLFEAGEVDHLVATDAIGMGLNLRLDHVAFAALRKFDGRQSRPLAPGEVAQIAGRAGRHMSDGTFGTTLGAGTLGEETVAAVEGHRFEPLRYLYWRSRDLNFRSPKELLRSLEAPPPGPQLERVREADDQLALAALIESPGVLAKATTPEALRNLWAVCQIPDFRKILSDHHVRLLGSIFDHLMDNDGHLPEDWLAGQLAYLARSDGGIDQLAARLSQIRTWTYVTHRGHWLADAAHWQERTRAIEDELSDALHDRLTQRFVDRRATLLSQRLRDGGDLAAAIRGNGEVLVEGQTVGSIEGFRLDLDDGLDRDLARTLMAAARKALVREFPARLKRLEAETDETAFTLLDGEISWRGQRLARLRPGDWVLTPRVEPLDSEFLSGPDRERLRRRLTVWLGGYLRQELAPLFALQDAALSGLARGLAFQLVEALGLLPRRAVARHLTGLQRRDRRALVKAGVTIGAECLYLPALSSETARRLTVLLWALMRGQTLPALPGPDTPLWALEDDSHTGLAQALGYVPLPPRSGRRLAVRAEALERFCRAAASLARRGPFAASRRLGRHLACEGEELHGLLLALGYEARKKDGERLYRPKRRKGTRPKARKAGAAKQPSRRNKTRPESPFAVLEQLKKDSRK